MVLVKVSCEVDNAVGTEAEHLDELETPLGDAVADEVLVLLVGARRRHGDWRSKGVSVQQTAGGG